jgi:DNA-binding MarR family transcriptional regulator
MNSRDHFRPVQLRHIVMVWTHHVEQFMGALFGMEMPEGRLLWLLAKEGPTTATQLCGLAYMRKFQVSRSLAKMRGLGLVSMTPHPNDLRSEIIQLTDLGVRTSQTLLTHSLKWADLLEQNLSTAEHQALDSALTKMLNNAEHLGPVVEADLALARSTAKKGSKGKPAAKPAASSAPVAQTPERPLAKRVTTPRRLHLR